MVERASRRLPAAFWLVVVALAGCATDDRADDPANVAARRTGSVRIVDTHASSEGEGTDASCEWELDGDWLRRGERRVPAGVIDRLRELAREAPGADAPLPDELGITERALESGRYRIIEAAARWDPWIELVDATEEDVTLERVRAAAREKLLDPAQDTSYARLEIHLPGDPPIRLVTESESPFCQPWSVHVGDTAPRDVLSLEIARYAALLVDPGGPSAPLLEGADYWRHRFWDDHEVWHTTFAEEWADRYGRALCEELDGWDAVADAWTLRRVGIDTTATGEALASDLEATTSRALGVVRWRNPVDEDGDPTLDWSTFVDVHRRAEAAVRALPALVRWQEAGPGRALTMTAVGDRGHTETDPAYFHAPVWEHAELEGEPGFEIHLTIDGRWSGTVLLGTAAQGGVVLTGHPSLTGNSDDRFHPTVGDYGLLRADGTVERRKMPPITR